MQHGRSHRAARSAAVLLTGALLVSGLVSCSPDGGGRRPPNDIGSSPRDRVAEGGTLRWAVDGVPGTFNAFQADADQDTARVTGAVLPALFTLDSRGRPQRNPDYLASASVTDRKPRQVVVYRINPRAVWTDGTPVTVADFTSQWKALHGADTAFWPARNDGYRQIGKVERGRDDREVRVTFDRRYADWRMLFTPLYPKSATATPDAFNDGTRVRLTAAAGPFRIKDVDRGGADGSVTLVRNTRWWGERAKLDRIVLAPVPEARRVQALREGRLDVAGLEPGTARPPVLPGVTVRKGVDASFTQLTLNGADGPLADEQVRRAVARAIDRKELAGIALEPAGLPVQTLGNHLVMTHQTGYEDNSAALGGPDRRSAEALLAKAGWMPGGEIRATPSASGAAAPPAGGKTVREQPQENAAGRKSRQKAGQSPAGDPGETPETASAGNADGEDAEKKNADGDEDGQKSGQQAGTGDGEGTDAGSRSGGAKSATVVGGPKIRVVEPPAPRVRRGRPLSLRLLVPERAGTLGAVADRVGRMLSGIGVRTEITEVGDEGFFRDHVASGQFDLALFSWPGTAYPATDDRPIYAKPLPAPDGSLIVEQNYARVGTDEIDQLFEQASAEPDPGRARRLADRVDARIWAAAHSLPLYQRPQTVAVRTGVANVGAFGFRTPRYQDIGFTKRPGS